MRAPHQGSAVTSRRQAAEVFQSSCTSWSSKIIAVGMTEKSQRTSGSLQASRYRAQYSSKSAISSSGAALADGALAGGALVDGATPVPVTGGCGLAAPRR